MKAKLLRALALCAYVGALFVLFGLVAYSSFSLFVRSGVTRTPDVSGLARDAAANLLSDQGLEIEVADEGRFSENVPSGHAMIQEPAAGALVKVGSRVAVVLSQGPQRMSVPDLSGQALPAAQVALTAAGLGLGRTLTVQAADGVPGTIVAQRPAATAQVPPGARVDVMLAAADGGETFVMPDVVYRDFDRVRRFFERRGLRLGNVRFETYEGIADGVILRQFPLAGHPLRRQDVISLVVATTEATP